MNETLSALIAFVSILILFSIIVQSAQEAVKNILKLRVGVWERFFINLYSKDTEFNIGKISISARFGMYIKRIWSGNFTGEFDKGFARLKEMLITADDTFKRLKKSLLVIVELNPNAADTPRLILYQLQPVLEAIGRAKGLALSKFLYIYVEVFKKEDLKRLYNEIKKFEIQHAKVENLLQSSTKGVVASFQIACKNLLRAIEAVEDQGMEAFEDRISEYRIQAEQNIDSWIGQINEEYRRNMLKWTVAIGFVFVIIANADSFSIYQYLRSDTKAQAAIAEKLKDITVVKQTADPEDLNKILVSLKENKLQDAQNISGSFLAKLESDYRTVGAGIEADKIKQLKESVKNIDIGKNDEIRKKLEEEYAKIADFNIRLPGVIIEKQMAGLTELDLPLGWTSDRQKYKDLKASDASEKCTGFILKKIGGLLLTAVLITFGAPFWNDILKALTGIKDIARRK